VGGGIEVDEITGPHIDGTDAKAARAGIEAVKIYCRPLPGIHGTGTKVGVRPAKFGEKIKPADDCPVRKGTEKSLRE
jgi:hypothetical protein